MTKEEFKQFLDHHIDRWLPEESTSEVMVTTFFNRIYEHEKTIKDAFKGG